MLAGAEAEVPLRAAVDLVGVRVGKFSPVAIARAEGERDLVADVQGLLMELRLTRDGALEALRRSIEAQRFLDRRLDQRRVGDHAAPRIGKIMQIEREHAHEARQRLDTSHDEGRGGEHDLAFAQSIAVDLGLGEMGDQVVGRTLAPLRDLGGEEVAELLKGGNVLGIAPLHRLIGRDRENDLAPDVGVVARGQAHGAEQEPDGDLAGEIVDELEVPHVADAVERAVGNLERRRDQMLGVLARECGLAQRPQAVVAGRIGRPQCRAGAAGKLVDHVALRRREGFPVARRQYDVVVAREDPELAVLAPVAGMLLAQDGVMGKWIGIDVRRIEIECFQRHLPGNVEFGELARAIIPRCRPPRKRGPYSRGLGVWHDGSPTYVRLARHTHVRCRSRVNPRSGAGTALWQYLNAMSKEKQPESAEERLIARYFKPLATHPGALGLLDDAAGIAPPAGCDLVLKTDGVIAGVHFFIEDPPDTVAKKVLRMNLSDLAAKGARPLGFLLALALPQGVGEAWLAPFA